MVVFNASKFILSGTTPGPTKSIAQSLLINHGYIHPVGKGLYSLLPLGLRVVEKLSRLIDYELECIGAQKVSLPILGPKELWDRTDRWSSMGAELIQVKDRQGAELCLQPTAEEMCTQLVAQLPQFKKTAFPLMIYQTTEKFRDEMNPRYGLLRARQFLMKDLYSFDTNRESSTDTYDLVTAAYEKILMEKLQLDVFKVRADSGVHGGRLSHEYHLRNPLEEDGIHYCKVCESGVKRDEFPCMDGCSKCEVKRDHESFSTVEIAHTFQLGTRYSQALKASHLGHPLEMCCFGIGVSRLLPATVELLSPSSHVIRLPKIIAPFDAAVVVTKSLQSNVLVEMTLSTLDRRLRGGILFDDRVEQNVGKRLKELNQLGIPRIVVLGKTTEKTLNETPLMEYLTSDFASPDLHKKGEVSLNQLMQLIEH